MTRQWSMKHEQRKEKGSGYTLSPILTRTVLVTVEFQHKLQIDSPCEHPAREYVETSCILAKVLQKSCGCWVKEPPVSSLRSCRLPQPHFHIWWDMDFINPTVDKTYPVLTIPVPLIDAQGSGTEWLRMYSGKDTLLRIPVVHVSDTTVWMELSLTIGVNHDELIPN